MGRIITSGIRRTKRIARQARILRQATELSIPLSTPKRALDRDDAEIIGQLSIRARAGRKPGRSLSAYLPAPTQIGNGSDLRKSPPWNSIFIMESDGVAVVEKELAPLQFAWHFAPDVPGIQRRKLVKQKWDHNISDVWPQLPLATLGGKSPLEAAGNDALKVPLAAALNVLEAFCDSRSFPLLAESETPQPVEASGAPADCRHRHDGRRVDLHSGDAAAAVARADRRAIQPGDAAHGTLSATCC